jgi:hypothetical protein
MKLPRRNFLHLAAGAAALPGVSRFAWAQTYPARPVRIIVPGAAQPRAVRCRDARRDSIQRGERDAFEDQSSVIATATPNVSRS